MKGPQTWTTREGVELRIRDMGTTHIQNCLRMLDRNAAREELAWCLMPGPNGDAATDLFDAEFDRLLQEPASEWIKRRPIYRAFRKELRRRGKVR